MLTALPAVWLADLVAPIPSGEGGGKLNDPRISPNKHLGWLGGAILTGMLSGLLLVLLLRTISLPADTPLAAGCADGLILSILTPIGDLLISLFNAALM